MEGADNFVAPPLVMLHYRSIGLSGRVVAIGVDYFRSYFSKPKQIHLSAQASISRPFVIPLRNGLE